MKKIKNINKIQDKSGATLIVLIISMVVIAVIGMAIYSMTYTASLNQVVAQRAAKAFYVAESCVRVAASEYKASASKNVTLVSLHNQTFPMPDNQGSCTVLIYPYWFYATAIYAANASPIILYLPGEVPRVDEDGTTAIAFPANGNLKIKGASGAVAVFSSATIGAFNAAAGGTPVTFALSTPFSTAIAVNDEFYIGYNYTGTATPNAGGNLVLNINNNDMGRIFPPSKGSIFVENASVISQYSYDERIINSGVSVTLTNMQQVTGAPVPVWPITISNTPIYVGKSLGLRSTSTYGD
jgi:type II secretory pathway pseudopilin PulG